MRHSYLIFYLKRDLDIAEICLTIKIISNDYFSPFNDICFRLAMSDNLLIIDSFIQKSLIPYFTSNAPFEPYWFKISNPYFWHPFKGIIVTVTIYLMVAISAERFRAICYPLSKRQVRNLSR